ncbi:cytochrome c oxidase subunit II [Roseospira marina]|uniref:Cytochrome c oxidase subunit 2 n=1 Tax=Roseospira marina TaxID=140057 RepID=A0A5M6ICQ7_9PROT|nr:cytochrome c oxidase subunit II [Roseospira marina]KAA5606060.1 cytochrome c oxidase subunit II [Roseospira marina]MBB4313076.1 cytochrome c oxidase subunit 2 [Roseospira marina]MBB5086183.1 cytochrome c oxidase subunit 2 [Roseospira marina]
MPDVRPAPVCARTVRRTGWIGTHIGTVALLILGLPCAAALAAQPEPWQMWSQPAATPTMHLITDLHAYLNWLMLGVCVAVMGALGFVLWRFHHSRNPEPSTWSHNTPLEVAWTLIPVAILVAVAMPSFKLLYFMDSTEEADFTVKVIGHQWYWSYEYPDHGNFTFDSWMKYPEELEGDEPRLLAVDEHVVVPVGATVRLLFTSDDVIHSWAVPALGIKNDSIPGRISESWMQIEQPGTYYGQCSELCGVNHGFMPIAVRAVPDEEFQAWLADAQENFARVDPPPPARESEPVSVADAAD